MASSASEKGIRKAKAQAKKDAEIERVVIQALMTKIDGRRWVWIQLSECQLFHSVQSVAEMSHEMLAWREGLRNRGLRLLAAVTRYAPDMYIRMTQENSTFVPTEEPVDDRPDPDSAEPGGE